MQHGKRRPVTSPEERIYDMTKTYTIDNTTYTVRTCTAVAVSIGETERVDALYVDYYAESGEHVENVIFNESMPEDEEDFVAMFDYPDEWDSYYRTIATVCFEGGVNIDDSINAAAKRIREAHDWEACESKCAELCEAAGMFDEWREADGETLETVINKAARILGVRI